HGCTDWDTMNLRGLEFENNRDLAWLPPGQPRRMFAGGGSDAHGDLNYRRAGYFLGATDATDTAIGKPRNLLFVGDPAGPQIGIGGPPIPDVPITGSVGPTNKTTPLAAPSPLNTERASAIATAPIPDSTVKSSPFAG